MGRRELDGSSAVLRLRRIRPEAATERWIAELRGLMWKDAGLLRDGDGLREAQRGLDALAVTHAARAVSAGAGGEESACGG